MKVSFGQLKKAAREVREEMAAEGVVPRGVRLKPRSRAKAALLYTMAVDRMEQYPPRRKADGKIILPYFRHVG